MHFIQALTLGATTLFATAASALYTKCDHYNASNFFDEFSFFSGGDPTGGFVNYQNASQANLSSLAGYTLESSQSLESIFLGVDCHTMNPPAPGRNSVRVTSNKAYTQGLFIADIAHMPSECGVWPAFWTFGPNWPKSGEIDIIEGVNQDLSNTITLHTSEVCVMSGSGSLPSSNLTNMNCNADSGFAGCSTTTAHTQGYGPGFNKIGGGVYSMLWNSTVIAVWFFPRNAIPKDILAANERTSPDPSKWGVPTASFSGPGCGIDAHFQNHSIVFDTTFCGQWAGSVWSHSSCAALAPTCNQYVAEHPSAFEGAYWLINKVMVYQDYDAAGTNRTYTR